MVGYIVGLGDRHGENILFLSTTGECMHVDFNCLFNKGETFDVPERVPFRLTRNMVEALGASGVEGVFRRTCEVTMSVLRAERDALKSVLTTFVYDPLLEFETPKSKPRTSTPGHVQQEQSNQAALDKLKPIESRLRGVDKKYKGPPLSVEGQV